jgi:hypothetical protein
MAGSRELLRRRDADKQHPERNEAKEAGS